MLDAAGDECLRLSLAFEGTDVEFGPKGRFPDPVRRDMMGLQVAPQPGADLPAMFGARSFSRCRGSFPSRDRFRASPTSPGRGPLVVLEPPPAEHLAGDVGGVLESFPSHRFLPYQSSDGPVPKRAHPTGLALSSAQARQAAPVLLTAVIPPTVRIIQTVALTYQIGPASPVDITLGLFAVPIGHGTLIGRAAPLFSVLHATLHIGRATAKRAALFTCPATVAAATIDGTSTILGIPHGRRSKDQHRYQQHCKTGLSHGSSLLSFLFFSFRVSWSLFHPAQWWSASRRSSCSNRCSLIAPSAVSGEKLKPSSTSS